MKTEPKEIVAAIGALFFIGSVLFVWLYSFCFYFNRDTWLRENADRIYKEMTAGTPASMPVWPKEEEIIIENADLITNICIYPR